jgi:hypothetical protein
MKIIVSTKAFSKCIEAAILDNCKNIAITPSKKEIRFVCEHNNLELEIELNPRECIIAYTFNPIQMYKLMVFINLLLDQPIVIDFYQRTETEVSIELTQFVHKF